MVIVGGCPKNRLRPRQSADRDDGIGRRYVLSHVPCRARWLDAVAALMGVEDQPRGPNGWARLVPDCTAGSCGSGWSSARETSGSEWSIHTKRLCSVWNGLSRPSGRPVTPNSFAALGHLGLKFSDPLLIKLLAGRFHRPPLAWLGLFSFIGPSELAASRRRSPPCHARARVCRKDTGPAEA